MGFDLWTFVLQSANFAVLVWLLHRFLYRPVLKIIAARKAEIEHLYQESTAAKSAAEAQLTSATAERAGIVAERDAVLSRLAAQAEEAAAARQAQAARDAAALLESAQKKLATERIEALAEARRIAIDLAADMARRLLSEIPVSLRIEGWLERVEQYLAALPAADRQSLAHQLDGGAMVRVVSAWPLPAEAGDLWPERLGRVLQRDVRVELASDPSLIAGVELYFPAAILQLTWKSELAVLCSPAPARQEAHADAH